MRRVLLVEVAADGGDLCGVSYRAISRRRDRSGRRPSPLKVRACMAALRAALRALREASRA